MKYVILEIRADAVETSDQKNLETILDDTLERKFGFCNALVSKISDEDPIRLLNECYKVLKEFIETESEDSETGTCAYEDYRLLERLHSFLNYKRKEIGK